MFSHTKIANFHFSTEVFCQVIFPNENTTTTKKKWKWKTMKNIEFRHLIEKTQVSSAGGPPQKILRLRFIRGAVEMCNHFRCVARASFVLWPKCTATNNTNSQNEMANFFSFNQWFIHKIKKKTHKTRITQNSIASQFDISISATQTND